MMPLLELVRRRDLFPHINKKRKATVYSNVEDELARLARWHCRRSGRSVSRNSSGKARHFLQEHQADLALQKLSCDKPLPATNLGQLQKMLVAACIPNDLLPDFGSPRTGTSRGQSTRRPKPRSATTPCWKNQPWRRDANETASGKPGTVQGSAARPAACAPNAANEKGAVRRPNVVSAASASATIIASWRLHLPFLPDENVPVDGTRDTIGPGKLTGNSLLELVKQPLRVVIVDQFETLARMQRVVLAENHQVTLRPWQRPQVQDSDRLVGIGRCRSHGTLR